MVVDFQHHYVPEQLAREKGLYSDKVTVASEGGVPRMTLHAKLYDAEAQLRDMDEAGVDVSVVSCHLGWDGSLEDCRVINDSYAELEREYGGRFVGLAHAPVLEGDEALDELDRAILERGLHGVTITSQVGGLFLDSPELDRFYARVARLDVPIFVHPALVPKGYDSIQGYDLPRIIGREIDLTIATIRLIAGGVLDRHPEIDFVIGHFGGGIAAFKDRLVAMAHRFGTLKHPFEEYLDRLYFDISGFEGGITAFRCGLLGIRPERLVFATDYPQNFTGVSTETGKGNQAIREYIEAVRNLELDEQVKEDILGGTAARLLKLGH